MEKEDLETVFPKIWSRETSAFPETWSPSNPAHGQCLQTARIVERCLGGVIIITFLAKGIPHFYNILYGGDKMDFTRSQFSVEFDLPPGRVITVIELDAFGRVYTEVGRRYSLLALRFTEQTGIPILGNAH